MTDKLNLEEYEKIVEDHGHLTVYYPKPIIQETLRKRLIQELQESICQGTLTPLRKVVEEIVNETIRGY